MSGFESLPLSAMRTTIGCLTTLFFLGSVRGKTTVNYPKIQPVYIKSGDKLDMRCEQMDGFNIHWLKADKMTWLYEMIDSSEDSGFFTISHTDMKTISKQEVQLIKDNVSLEDAGSYRCAVPSGADMPYTVEVYVVQVAEKSGTMTNLRSSTTIGCVFSMREKMSVSVYWSRNNKTIDTTTREIIKYHNNTIYSDNTTEFMLTVENVGEADVGLYQCNIELKNGNKFIHDVNLYAFPQVKPMGRSKNLVAGTTLELSCKVWGWPLPNVTWTFEGGKPLNLSDSRIFVSNGTLKIENLVDSDRAVYVCTAGSEVDGSTWQRSSTSVLVRVKGKLAILWPILGLIIEAIVLSFIIYFYERNRARKRAEQESREMADQQTNSNAQPRHHQQQQQQGRDNLRYRK